MDKQVIRQCLSHLPLQDFSAPILDYRKQLTTANLLKIFVTAQLLKWDSLSTIEQAIRSDQTFRDEFERDSMNKSQLSRRMNALPLEVTQALFEAVVHATRSQVQPGKKSGKSPLAIVDSTSLKMPPLLGDWAYVTEKQNCVKVHTRLMVIDEDTAYPDQIVPSTGNVSDYIGSDTLVVDSDVLYVMDRGYVCYKRMQRWATTNIDFVIRLGHHHFAEVLDERDISPEEQRVVRDATVILGNQPKTRMTAALRLIEFYDEQGRFYRLATTRQDLSAEEIMNVYRNRWLIELFFKWLKQHLKFAQIYSHQPNAVWNHIYLALVAYGLAYLVKHALSTKHSTWDVLKVVRLYATKSWSDLVAEVYRPPRKFSLGKKKKGTPGPRSVEEQPGVLIHHPKKRNR